MKRLTQVTIDLGSGTGPMQNRRLNPPPMTGAMGVTLSLHGQAQNPPTLQLFDGQRKLGEVRGFDQPLHLVLPAAQALDARVSWSGWSEDLELRAAYVAGSQGAFPLLPGVTLALRGGEAATLTLAAGEGVTLTATGQAAVSCDGRSVGMLGTGQPLSLTGPGLFVVRAAETLTLTREIGPPGSGPSPPVPDPGPETLPPAGEVVVLVPDQPTRLLVAAAVGAYLEIEVDAGEPFSAQLLDPQGRVVASTEARAGLHTLTAPLTVAGEYTLVLDAAVEAEVGATCLLALPAEPGEYRIQSDGEHHGWLLTAQAGEVLGVQVMRPEGAADRPRLLIADRNGTLLAHSAYRTHITAAAPADGTYLLRANYDGTPYTDVTLFLTREVPDDFPQTP